VLVFRAAKYGSVAGVKTLIEAGAEIDKKDGKGHSPLHLALIFGRERTALALLDAGASADLAGQVPNETPLLLAARCPLAKALAALITAGASNPGADTEGRSAAYHSARFALDVGGNVTANAEHLKAQLDLGNITCR